jgi:anti-sigma factor RsiW
MECPEQDFIERLLEGELSDSEKKQLAEHISKCQSCREKYELEKLFYLGLEKAFAEDTCPEQAELEAYLEGKLSDARKKEIENHLVTCHRCETELGFLRNPESVKEWEKKEEKLFRLAQAEGLAHEVARRVEKEIFPKAGVVGRIWSKVSVLFDQLREKNVPQWHGIVRDKATAGAMGFSGGMPPEVEAAAVMSLTVLGMAHRLAEGEDVDLEQSTEELAKAFGAGSALGNRLKQVAPTAFREAMKEREM